MSRKKSLNVKHIRTAALIVLVVVLFAAALLMFSNWEKKQGQFSGESSFADGVISHGGKEYVQNENIETVLVIGLDTFSETVDDTAFHNDKLADFLLLLVLDNENSTVSAVQINRDTMADINVLDVAGKKINTVNRQIALAHTYGNGKEVSCRNTADAVSGLLLDIKIDHYVSVTMDAVQPFNDLVGGVSLELLDDFTAFDEAMIKGETVTLTGEQALLYVRTRYGLDDSTNIHRMERQRQYMQALYDAIKTKISADEGFVATAASELSKYMVSNCSVHQLQNIISKVTTYTTSEIHGIEGDSVKGEEYMEFRPDETALKELAIDLFFVSKD